MSLSSLIPVPLTFLFTGEDPRHGAPIRGDMNMGTRGTDGGGGGGGGLTLQQELEIANEMERQLRATNMAMGYSSGGGSGVGEY